MAFLRSVPASAALLSFEIPFTSGGVVILLLRLLLVVLERRRPVGLLVYAGLIGVNDSSNRESRPGMSCADGNRDT